MKREHKYGTALTTLALWLALAGTASAHPPHVEPWMHAVGISISGILGVATGLLLRTRAGLSVAVGVGFCVFLLCSFGGLLLSLAASM